MKGKTEKNSVVVEEEVKDILYYRKLSDKFPFATHVKTR